MVIFHRDSVAVGAVVFVLRGDSTKKTNHSNTTALIEDEDVVAAEADEISVVNADEDEDL